MRFIYEQENFLTKEKCDEWIQISEQIGYQESLIYTKEGAVRDTKIRDNDRIMYDNTELAEKLFQEVKELLPVIDGWETIGLNERFRYYRYKDGQQFKAHRDAKHIRSETEESKVTLLLYLSEDFKGGQTTFVLENRDIIPQTGKLLLFSHEILHCGRPCTEGIKYVIRTDVMYKKV